MYQHKRSTDASLVHFNQSENHSTTIAHKIGVAESRFDKLWGMKFTEKIGKSYALIFPLSQNRTVSLNMVAVPHNLGVIYLQDTKITKLDIMTSWTGESSGTADTIIEVHPHLIEQLNIGDNLYLQGKHSINSLNKPAGISPKRIWSN